jgi:hypothetical protein
LLIPSRHIEVKLIDEKVHRLMSTVPRYINTTVGNSGPKCTAFCKLIDLRAFK